MIISFYYNGPDAMYRINLDGSGNEKLADLKYSMDMCMVCISEKFVLDHGSSKPESPGR